MRNELVQCSPVVLRRDEVREKLLAMNPEFEAHGITSVGLFGSVARDEATELSDIDLAVTTNGKIGLVGLCGVRLYAKEQFGVEVDLAFLSELSPIRLESAKEDLIPIF